MCPLFIYTCKWLDNTYSLFSLLLSLTFLPQPLVFEIRSFCRVQAFLELISLLPQPPMNYDYKYVPWCLDPGLSFQRCLYNKQPWRIEIILHSREKCKHVFVIIETLNSLNWKFLLCSTTNSSRVCMQAYILHALWVMIGGRFRWHTNSLQLSE